MTVLDSPVEASPQTEPARRKRGDIQGLRAIAVLLVIFDHFDLPGFAGGFIGVDMFFVISGFLITGLLVHEAKARGRISLVGFWARRARRLLPAATVVLLASLATIAVVGAVAEVERAGIDALWSAGFLTNVHLATSGTDYFATESPSLFQHYWSLAVEEQFYLVWPLLVVVMIGRRARRGLMLAIVATLAIASLAWSIDATDANAATAYFNTFARGFEFAGGAFLAILAPRFPRWVCWILGVAGAAGLTYSVLTMTAATPIPGWHALIPVLATMALLAAPAGPVSQLLRLAPLRAIGTISYSLYLWHWPVWVLAPQMDLGPLSADELSTTEFNCLMFAAATVLSILTWALIELPFQHSKVPGFKASKSLILWPLSLALIASTAWGAGQFAEDRQEMRNAEAARWEAAQAPVAPTLPLSERIAAAVAEGEAGAPMPAFDLEAHRRDSWSVEFGCFASGEGIVPPDCAYGDTAAETLVVVHGDSHAAMWLPALDAWGKEEHFKVVPLIKLGCSPFYMHETRSKADEASCVGFRKWAQPKIDELAPDLLVVGYRGVRSIKTAEMSSAQRWQAGVESLAAAIKGPKRTVVLGDVPIRPSSTEECAGAPGNTLADCAGTPTGGAIEANASTQAGLAGTGIDYVDTVDFTCTPTTCPIAVDGTWLYLDDDHLAASWVREVLPELRDRIGPVVGSAK